MQQTEGRRARGMCVRGGSAQVGSACLPCRDVRGIPGLFRYHQNGPRTQIILKVTPDQLPLLKLSRAERIAAMDEILDVQGAARVLGVSARTVYNLARQGEIPAMRIGREWRFARKNLVEWVANASQADQVAAALRNGRVVRRRT
jgi:excisionase family DNA binding protein